MELGYQGNEGHKLELFRNYNEPVLRTGPGDATTLQPRRPWTDLGQIQSINGIVNSNYQALSAKLTQQLSKGLTLLGSFTWSKAIDDVLLTPGTRNWDFSAIKNTRITESQSLRFRFEAFKFCKSPELASARRQRAGTQHIRRNQLGQDHAISRPG